MNEPPHSPPPLSDSPLFWLFLFSACALFALLAIGPKHLSRQGRLELQKQVREQVWQARSQRNAGGQRAPPSQAPAQESAAGTPLLAPRPAGGIWPLAVLLALVTAALGAALTLTRRRAARRPPADSTPARAVDRGG